MQFRMKNDDGIELHLNVAERKLVFEALRHYMAYGKDNNYIVEQVPKICEILNVMELPEFKKGE